MSLFETEHRTCRFSDCRRYRFDLVKRWDAGPLAAFIALNPSTADEVVDDPTVRRMTGFAQDWGYSGLWVLNLFAWRSTDPSVLSRCDDPVGHRNLSTGHLNEVREACGVVVAAWGVHGRIADRDLTVIRRCVSLRIALKCLGTTKAGFPRHPLYLRKDAALIDYHGNR